MVKRATFVLLVIAAIAAPAAAQDSPSKAQESQPARSAAQSANIRIEITITDQRTEAQAGPKTLSLVLEDRKSGRLRTGRGNAILNLDVMPEIVREGRVRLLVSLEFTPQDGPDRQVQPSAVGLAHGARRRRQVARDFAVGGSVVRSEGSHRSEGYDRPVGAVSRTCRSPTLVPVGPHTIKSPSGAKKS